MTHNVVAQFSCSVYTAKDADMGRIPSGKSQGDFKDYQVINGSVFNEEFSEVLDSATILLSQISKYDRLVDIKSYQYVRIFDKSTTFNPTTGKYAFDKLFLVDTFNEEENNVKEHIFGYTINLMSETKWLEKWQCPNLTITHKIGANSRVEKKTIFDYIKQYMELYVPKMKFSADGINWSYEPVIKCIKGNVFSQKCEFPRITRSSFAPYSLTESDVQVIISWNNLCPNVPFDDLDVDSIEISNQTEEGNILFNTKSITFDDTNQRFVFYGRALTSSLSDSSYAVIGFDLKFNDTSFSKKFNVPCADLSFNAPTLRQVLTTLMQQVSCIPVVKNRILSYLDFKQEAVPFGGEKGYNVNNTVNRRQRGLSSDSFVNTLVNMSENVLDSGNNVYCESLGFRDRDRALLKQKENLFLETKFPIYKVINFTLNAYTKADVKITNIFSSFSGSTSWDGTPIWWTIVFSKPTSSQVQADFRINVSSGNKIIIQGNLVAFKYASETTQLFSISKTIHGGNYVPGVDDVLTFNLSDEAYDLFYFYGRITFVDENETYASSGRDVFASNFNGNYNKALSLYSQNITPLLLENSIRQGLSTDFVEMITNTDSNRNPTIETLSQYIYGTIGYNIGSKKIEGFSEVFAVGNSTALGWINADYTYIENIWTFITKNYQNSIKQHIRECFGNAPEVHDKIYSDGQEVSDGGHVSYSIENVTPYNPWNYEGAVPALDFVPSFFYSDMNFGVLWFDITYQPLNSFNIAYTKTIEDVDFPIAQYDGNASGVTDFDRLSIHEQEQVDRIGNEVLTIRQRTSDVEDIQDFSNGPLYYEDDTDRDDDLDENDTGIKYIIFKRSFTINNNCFNASYVASKDAVLKDYFTSIRTKYRAYQYVGYNDSVVRKERDTFFVKMSEKGWYDGDDKVFFGEFSNYVLGTQINLWHCLIPCEDYIFFNSYNHVTKAVSGVQTKNDFSKISHRNFISFIYEEYDNVSSGPYISSDSFQQCLDMLNEGVEDGSLCGGIPQTWQIWNDSYYTRHYVSFIGKINIADIFDTYMEASSANLNDILEDFDKVMKMPILDTSLSQGKTVFSIVSDKSHVNLSNDNKQRVFYKDLSERINHSIQFIYYTDSNNILWSESFLNNFVLPLNNDTSGTVSREVVDITGEPFEINSEPYISSESTVNIGYTHLCYVVSNNVNPYIYVNWPAINSVHSNMNQFKIIEKVWIGNVLYTRDVVAFRRAEAGVAQKFYITLNDTKSDYVMAERDGILFRRYKVRQNTWYRLVDKIHDL